MSTNASGTASSESAVELSLQPDNAILIDEDGTVGEDEGHETGSTASNASTEIADGELLQLMESVNEDSTPLPPRIEMAVTRELSVRDHLQIDSLTDKAYYGHPLPLSEAEEQMPVGNEGLIWHALIIPDEYFVKGKLKRGLNPRDFDAVNCKIKPRRPSLPVTATDFFSSLTRVEGPEKCQARYIFHGLLNGWPSLRTLELIALEERRGGSALPSPKDLLTGQFLWSNTWSAKDEGMCGKDPKILQQPNPIYSIISQQQQQHRIYRATLRGAPWSGTGWSDEAPGFVFWYEAEAATPRVSHGTNIVRDLLDPTPQCTTVHMISHRYAVERESPRDRLTYHSLCLLEWSHGKYCTVAEAAYLNGTGGHKGKVNWYDDRDEPVTAFYKMMPPEMVAPWKTRCVHLGTVVKLGGRGVTSRLVTLDLLSY